MGSNLPFCTAGHTYMFYIWKHKLHLAWKTTHFHQLMDSLQNKTCVFYSKSRQHSDSLDQSIQHSMALYSPLTGRCYRRELLPLANCSRQIRWFASLLWLELCTSICYQLRCRLQTKPWVLKSRHCFSHRWQRLEDFQGSRSCENILNFFFRLKNSIEM